MPGPGGGARGGGGGRGGFGGGGFHGGGFGGGFHGGGFHGGRPPHRGMYGGWHWRPRYYGGGGCLSGLLGMVMAPIILLIVAGTFLFSVLGSAFSTVSQGGVSAYDENALQDYADEQYAAAFGSSTAYEDNILLVFLAEDDSYYDYYYIAWVGDHIHRDITDMLGSEQTELGRAMASSVNESSYKYSLDSNLARVIGILEDQVEAKGLTSSFTCKEDHAQVSSYLTNKTGLALTEETVNGALQSFTDTTGIPIVLVVEDVEDVFPRQTPAGAIITVVIAGAILVLAVWLIVRGVRKKNSGEWEPWQNDSDSRY